MVSTRPSFFQMMTNRPTWQRRSATNVMFVSLASNTRLPCVSATESGVARPSGSDAELFVNAVVRRRYLVA